MKVKANINGKIHERSVKKPLLKDGHTVHFIAITRFPYIVQMHNGQPVGLITLEQVLKGVSV